MKVPNDNAAAYNKCVEQGKHPSFLVGSGGSGCCVCCGLPQDYKPCDDCGFDHSYEPFRAAEFHSQEVVGR